ncbi:MAG: nucleotidyltransferase domain-containing protein [Bdellovibrio sp.]
MKKADQKIINEIKETLKDAYNPLRLFLFGSRANSTATKDSDYDFVMVVPNPKKSTLHEMSKARSLVFNKHLVSADVFIYSEKEFDEWKDEFSSIPETALNTGIEIPLTKNPRKRIQG